MTIKQLEYTRTVNLGSFESANLSAVGEVLEHEEPEAALQELRDWVENEIGQAADLALERRQDRARHQEIEREQRIKDEAFARQRKAEEVPY